MNTFPVSLLSYAIAAFTTGTVMGCPMSDVNPDTVALRPVSSKTPQYFPTTGESAWLSSSVAVTT